MTPVTNDAAAEDGQDALRRIAHRQEVLEICFWFQGEGFGDRFTVESVKTFLGIAREDIHNALETLAAEGALVRDGPGYRFSPDGQNRAGRLFHETFADFQVGTHGECTAGCCDSDAEGDHDHGHGDAQLAGAPASRP